MRILYLDLFFLLNLLTDYLICLSTGRLCSVKLRRKRYLGAALFGSTYAVTSIIPQFAFLSSIWGKLASAAGMGLLAFGQEHGALRCILSMLLVSSAFGGAFYALSQALGGPLQLTLSSLFAFFLLCYGLIKLLSRFHTRCDRSQKAEIRLLFLGREALFVALVDSGNSVRCPETGEAILIASPKALKRIFLEYTVFLEELQPVELLQAFSYIPSLTGRMRLVPFRSLGGSGLLPVFRPDGLWINGKETKDLLVAVSEEAKGVGFDAII